jgi:hypothetical protein
VISRSSAGSLNLSLLVAHQVRVIRIVRVVKLLKYFRVFRGVQDEDSDPVAAAAAATAAAKGGGAGPGGDGAERLEDAGRISAKLSEMIAKRVAALVMITVICMPLLAYPEPVDASVFGFLAMFDQVRSARSLACHG